VLTCSPATRRGFETAAEGFETAAVILKCRRRSVKDLDFGISINCGKNGDWRLHFDACGSPSKVKAADFSTVLADIMRTKRGLAGGHQSVRTTCPRKIGFFAFAL
jgi:hypothetical protein